MVPNHTFDQRQLTVGAYVICGKLTMCQFTALKNIIMEVKYDKVDLEILVRFTHQTSQIV